MFGKTAIASHIHCNANNIKMRLCIAVFTLRITNLLPARCFYRPYLIEITIDLLVYLIRWMRCDPIDPYTKFSRYTLRFRCYVTFNVVFFFCSSLTNTTNFIKYGGKLHYQHLLFSFGLNFHLRLAGWRLNGICQAILHFNNSQI